MAEPANNLWELQHGFEDKAGNLLTCGASDCTIGAYAISREVTSEFTATSVSPGCMTCDFTGGLGDVFNPDEPRFVPNAPECYKRAAARILVSAGFTPINAIRIGRPDTAEMIDTYAAKPSE